ncbi:MAG: TIR domain-containing protein [Legionellaceae bacterium]|nr:TIR domain-containing protein [Legionellaceae bacterium]
MSGEIRNVFISHINEDNDSLKQLSTLLAGKGYTIRDSSINDDKQNNANNEQYIKSGILAPRINWASTIIVPISADTHKSDWVNWEIEYAMKMGKRIVGVWLPGAKDSDLPEALDLYANAIVGWQADRIIDAIEGRINEIRKADGSEAAPRPLPRFNC